MTIIHIRDDYVIHDKISVCKKIIESTTKDTEENMWYISTLIKNPLTFLETMCPECAKSKEYGLYLLAVVA